MKVFGVQKQPIAEEARLEGARTKGISLNYKSVSLAPLGLLESPLLRRMEAISEPFLWFWSLLDGSLGREFVGGLKPDCMF